MKPWGGWFGPPARPSARGRRSMARARPMARWTRGALKTPTGATGMMPRSTLVRLGLVEGPRTAGDGVDAMEVMLQRLAGLDGPKATVVACVRLVVGRKGTRDCRTFATPTASRRALLAWLAACRGTHVAMAATGGLRVAGLRHPGFMRRGRPRRWQLIPGSQGSGSPCVPFLGRAAPTNPARDPDREARDFERRRHHAGRITPILRSTLP
jgi:hypothetical protein